MNFTKVVFDNSVKTDIARVNRATGVLYLNQSIWGKLTAGEREFVLLHENGHLELQTASEYEANSYAINKYCPVQTLNNAELGKRIQVITEITDPERYILGADPVAHLGVDPISNIAGAVGDIFKTLPMIGIGSKSRMKEQNAAAANQLKLIDASGKSKTTLIVVGGVFLVVIIVLIFVFKK